MARTVGQYLIKETLGKGGYSWVKKGIDTKTDNPVALKFMARADKSWEKEQAEQVRTEIKSMIRINSKYVMKLFAYNLNCQYPDKSGRKGKEVSTILLVLEYCPGGELFDILYYTQQLDERTARTYFRQMIQGLKDCHDAGIVHRDIKPQNLLMDGNFQLKITDFGLSYLNDRNKTAEMKTCYVGTRGYQAPELLKKRKYTKACDIFSAAVVLFILLTGYPPFEEAHKEDKWYQPLALKNDVLFWNQHKGCGVPKKCQHLLTNMLAYHPKDRYTLEDIAKDPWFNGPVHTPSELKKVLKAKHRECISRRKMDKKKMSEMEHSLKVKREVDYKPTIDMLDKAEDLLSKVDVTPRQTLLTNRWYVKCETKEALARAYLTAQAILGFDGKAKLQMEELPDGKKNPWKLESLLTVLDKERETDFEIRLEIFKKKDEPIYFFDFRRIGGAISWTHYRKIWSQISGYMLADGNFKDEYESLMQKVEEEAVEENNAPVAEVAAA